MISFLMNTLPQLDGNNNMATFFSVVSLGLIPADPAALGHKRSSKWPKTRKEYLAGHAYCEACGVRVLLNVHHIRPFHLWPELELEPSNLMTLCETRSHNCHFLFGHLLSWKSFNLKVIEDCERIFDRINQRLFLRGIL